MTLKQFTITTIMLFASLAAAPLSAQIQPGRHQTDTVSPIGDGSALPYSIDLRRYDFGSADLPTLHSYAAAKHAGKWILVAGRTNGLHGFSSINFLDNFPSQFQNREVWVIDPVSKQSWRRGLEPSQGLTEFQINALTPTNNQFFQRGEELYMTGGYGVQSTNQFGDETFGTFDTLSAINLPGIIDWVQNGAGTAGDHIRMIQDPTVKVTGGAMYEVNGTAHLVFGQDFDGFYTPLTNGAYTNQVRSFDIVDDGTNLSIRNVTASAPDPNYRRRDLNVFPVLKPDGNPQTPNHELLVLSGVFTLGFGAWTVPVEIDASGNPTMADPNDPDTFKQGFNGYHNAKLGLYSKATGRMDEVLFGGISLQTRDPLTGQIISDDRLPFINDVTAVSITDGNEYSQHHLGYFPELTDQNGELLRFGANAEFFPADGIPLLDGNIIDFDALSEPVVLGYIFGGLTANAPHTRNGPGVSAASNEIFEVLFTPIPEPASIALLLIGVTALARRR